MSAHKVVIAEISEAPLDSAAHAAAVAHPAAGATVGFSGVVRDHDDGRSVHELEYVAHPSAAEILAEIAAEIAGLEHVEAVAVSHRVGLLAIGDVALAAAVSTAHRAEAYEACSRLVEEVKARVPIWKRQRFAEGDEEWVACP
ncbi:MAG TPA: molybdenum cofactor biosynthesis protein MoaE [Mycobacteriales bacterium]|jgi:molybdopterin synthase catalytic subunit|nr:molybdenum cofactor biosynthesis protein MoaE [Mycobacteriales bacterium]